MVAVAIQFLEDSPALKQISPRAARDLFREACQRMPVSRLLLGWNVPQEVLSAVFAEAARLGVPLYRWQPLLCGDGSLLPPAEWQTIGLDGFPVGGFRGLPEFTFMCPNKPAVREAVLNHLLEISNFPYQGLFLDRIRFPSPAMLPFSHLACFCESCCRAAQESDSLDLLRFQHSLRAYLRTPGAAGNFIASFFGNSSSEVPEEILKGLRDYSLFRLKSITNFVCLAAEMAGSQGMAVGLDCFSPSLASMVGQDLGALAQCCEWIKAMIYLHAWGPAGLPYELAGMATFLGRSAGLSETEALAFLERQSNLPLPGSLLDLQTCGLPSAALGIEIRRAREMGVTHLYAGLELVEMAGICELSAEQISRDWAAALQAGVEGVVLSWDLWHMPLERLDWVSDLLNKYA